MTPTDLLALAERATKGPHHIAERLLEGVADFGRVRLCCDNGRAVVEIANVRGVSVHNYGGHGSSCGADAAYIAAANPTVVAALVRAYWALSGIVADLDRPDGAHRYTEWGLHASAGFPDDKGCRACVYRAQARAALAAVEEAMG